MSICLYKMHPSTFEVTLMNEGTALIFDANRAFKQESKFIIPDGSFRQVDMVSILQQPGSIEIAAVIDEVFYKFETTKPINSCIESLTCGIWTIPFLGVRPLVIDGTKLMQYLFVVNKKQIGSITRLQNVLR